MVDPSLVLKGQTIAYTLYVIAILLLMAWFGYQITRGGKENSIKPGLFYSFVAFLVVIGVSLHIITHETIPWKPIDLNRSEYKADKTFEISIRDHEFNLPADTLYINKGDLVLFNVTSDDLTYGFGIFRQDNSMLFQMQVLPGHVNDILWKFEKPETLSIRSTEYSGWKGYKMYKKDVVIVK
jgi:cytochrome c oxidase subunit 2